VDLPGEARGIVLDTAGSGLNKGEPIFTGESTRARYRAGLHCHHASTDPECLLRSRQRGELWTPQIVKSITPPGGTPQEVQPDLIRRLALTPQTLTTLQEGMRAVVTTRHTGNLVDMPIKISGKTGTAEFGVPDATVTFPTMNGSSATLPADHIPPTSPSQIRSLP